MFARALLIGLALSAATPAWADRATADQLASEAAAAAAAGDLNGAAIKFRAAYAADPRPEFGCNVGVAYYKLADWTRAERYLRDCVDGGHTLEPSFLTKVNAALTAVEAALVTAPITPVDLVVEPANATVTLDVWPDEPVAGARRVWVAYGHHRLTVRAAGYVDQVVELDAASHAPSVQRVTLVRPPPIALAGGARGPSSPWPRRLLLGAGALAVVGVGLHVGAAYERSQMTDTADGWSAHYGAFNDLRAGALTSYGAALVIGAVGAYLHVRGGSESTGVAATPILAPGVAGLALAWRR